jgi:biofilm PGA synthesis N-glycosyltransferase PgaC
MTVQRAPMLDVLLIFAFYYPLIMAWVWMGGGIWYHVYWERKRPYDPRTPPPLPEHPPVTILLPCHNEGENVRDTVAWLMAQDYPDFEVIAINDGSRDNTGELLDELCGTYYQLRVLHLATNQGKAMGLRMGALASPNEFLVCIDGDALLDRNATAWLISHLVANPRVGAVTGNPRIRNRSTLLGKLQVGEFSSIIGLIKRAQQVYGRIFTVSGVVVAFRKSALRQVGYWSVDMVTEDIDVSWRLQLGGWEIRYEPSALCWILMPETLKGLWKQRLRWAQGGSEVLLRYWRKILTWDQRRMWPVFSEYLLSVIWANVMASIMVLWLASHTAPVPPSWRVETLFSEWHALMLGGTSLFQFGVSMRIDGRYERGLGRYYYWMIWYPLAYWLLSMTTTVRALPKALLKKRGTRAVWVSPDRGVQERK